MGTALMLDKVTDWNFSCQFASTKLGELMHTRESKEIEFFLTAIQVLT